MRVGCTPPPCAIRQAGPSGRGSLEVGATRRQRSLIRGYDLLTRAAAATGSAERDARGVLKDFEDLILTTHASTISALEELDGSGQCFGEDCWQRGEDSPNSGYGVTRVLEGGHIIEKGAVNISVIQGVLSEERAKAMSSRGRDVDIAGGQPYGAAAMSLVVHPAHPHVPTLRADVRVFQVGDTTWYGGGCDLTPAYLHEDDAASFHTHWRRMCDAHEPGLYARYKAWCDDYFYIPARKEHRGIGGIFFDDLDPRDAPFDAAQFVSDVGRGIVPSWQPIVERRRGMTFSSEEREWQLLRRGRYIEFNLLYDRGVRFGLDGGRLESIMVSAPPMVAWRYNVQPVAGSEEDKVVQVLRCPREWA